MFRGDGFFSFGGFGHPDQDRYFTVDQFYQRFCSSERSKVVFPLLRLSRLDLRYEYLSRNPILIWLS